MSSRAMTLTHANQLVGRPSWRCLDVVAVSLFLAVLGTMSWWLYQHRPIAGPATADRWALASYRDATYYPLLAVRDGVNPYDTVRDGDPQRYMQRYPVGDTFPLYSPLILMVFAPLAALPVDASMVAFTVLNVVLMVLLVRIALRAVGRPANVAALFGFSALLLASQPGRAAFNSGQVALPLALAIVGALNWGDRHVWRSVVLVAFTTMKVTFGGPLGLLLMARRDWRSALGGFVLGGILGGLGLLVIAARSGDLSVERMGAVLARNQSDFSVDPTVVPQTNKARIDLVAAAEHLVDHPLPSWAAPLVALAVLGITAGILWRASRSSPVESAVTTTSALAILAMNICIYHNVYDLPLLVVPIAACATAAHPTWSSIAPAWRWSVLALLVLPFVNVFWGVNFRSLLAHANIVWGSSDSIVGQCLFRLICAANGLALFGAWVILAVCISRRSVSVPGVT